MTPPGSAPKPWFKDGRLHFALGIEDTFVPQSREGERAIDEYELTEHYEHFVADFQLAKSTGAGLLRWGLPWYRIAPEQGQWDWSWTDRALNSIADAGIRPIIDLVHYGTPIWLAGQFAHPDYPQHVAEYAVRVAERYADIATDYTPVNEPVIHALFCGEYGYWPPYLSGTQGFTAIAANLARGIVLTQRGISEALADASFVHVEAAMKFICPEDALEHASESARLNDQVFLVEDLITGRVDDDHPLVNALRTNGIDDNTLTWLRENAVQPDVMGINYYPRHSTELFEHGVTHSGGFSDPRPSIDRGIQGLQEALTTFADRYGAPVMLTETCVTGSIDERIKWLDESVALIDQMRTEGSNVVGYTWWPLFDMYEWTWRHSDNPRSDHLLTMGLYDLIESDSGLLRAENPVADRFREHASASSQTNPLAKRNQHMNSARLTINTAATIGAINPRLFGSFVEQLGRSVYDGIYEPGHPLANVDGFRTDVIELVKELGVTAIRYPGGNFVSGFKWEDSVGPRSERPRRLDLAWHSTETNEVGLHEFQKWLDEVGSELMLAVNLGTRGTAEALDLLEYSNLREGSTLAQSRIEHGRTEPFDVRIWCLGNEMDGPWQLGHRSADDYGKLAAQTARAMKAFDPNLELVICGSSSSSMPTFAEWERVVLTHAYDAVDYISCHAYYENTGDLGSFLASGVDMDHFIRTVTASADHVKAVRGSDKTINISFDEWNIWYNSRYENVDKIVGVDNWPVAPRLLEDQYSVADAVVFGSLLITLLKHADRVTSASLAQLVNVIAPIMTEPGGQSWRQTTFFPFASTAHHAVGVALDVSPVSGSYSTDKFGDVPFVDAVASFDDKTGQIAVYVVNRSTDEDTELSLDFAGETGGTVGYSVTARTLSDSDIHAANTRENPERVGLVENTSATIDGGSVHITLPAVSWTEILLVPLG